jgi:hypothetical protein
VNQEGELVAYDLGWVSKRRETERGENNIYDKPKTQKTFSVGDDISKTCQWPLMINNPTELTRGELPTTRLYRMRS